MQIFDPSIPAVTSLTQLFIALGVVFTAISSALNYFALKHAKQKLEENTTLTASVADSVNGENSANAATLRGLAVSSLVPTDPPPPPHPRDPSSARAGQA